MPQQLIYTSAPRGLVAGRSGYCTVARSASMREVLMLQLERFSYYHHLSLSGGKERPIFAYRIVDIRGSRFHVLSRIQDAGLDFTGRTNFIAHHLVFAPEEIRQYATPPVIFREWKGWVTSWSKEPGMLEDKDWNELASLAGSANIPGQTWQRLSGDAVNGYGLLEARAGASFQVDGMTEDDVLKLFAESLELLEIRDAHRDFRSLAWNYTFTTSMQEQDNPADFRWRCFHADNPVANKFAAQDTRALSTVCATKVTDEEAAFARTGPHVPQFVNEPENARVMEGQIARFAARAEGVPRPTYQWFSVDRANHEKVLPGETNPELVVSNPVLGISRFLVRANNRVGEAQSKVATLNVNPRARVATIAKDDSPLEPVKSVKPAIYKVKTAEDIERDRERHRVKQEQETVQKKTQLNKILLIVGMIMAALIVAGVIFKDKFMHEATLKPTAAPETTNTITANSPNQKPIEVFQAKTNSPAAKSNSQKIVIAPFQDASVSTDLAKAKSQKTNSIYGKQP